MKIRTKSNDEVTVSDFMWFSNLHKVMKNCLVVNHPHMVDNTTFQPTATTTNTAGVDSPVSNQELNDGNDVSLYDLCIRTLGETTPTDSHTSTPKQQETQVLLQRSRSAGNKSQLRTGTDKGNPTV